MNITVLQPPYPDRQSADSAGAALQWMLERLAEIRPGSTDLVVLPEYANAPGLPLGPDAAAFAQTQGSEFVRELHRQAARLRAAVCTGVLAVEPDGFRSRTLLIRPDGDSEGSYDKVHVTEAEKEAGCLPGSVPGIVRLGDVTIGVASCFDVYFPEYIETLAFLGARIIVSPSYQRSESPERIRLLSAARSVDSGAVFVRSAYAMPNPDRGGASLIALPDGSIAADAGAAPGVIRADVDPHSGFRKPASYGRPEVVHRELIESCRRPDLYRPAAEGERNLASAPFPRLCAHRGLSTVCPENTLPAFAAALATPSVTEVEFDLWLSRDGVPVVCHDASVDRTTDGSGRIADLSWDEISALDAGVAFAPEWRGVRMPCLEQVLDLLGHHVVLNIHVKEPGSDGVLVRMLTQELRRRGLTRSAYIAGDAAVLDAARSAAPEIPRCSLEAQHDPALQIDSAVQFGCERLQFGRIASVEHIRRARSLGLICNLFWSDDPDDARARIEDGIQVLLTNCAHVLDRAGVVPLPGASADGMQPR